MNGQVALGQCADQAFIVEDGVIKMRTLKLGYRGLETVEILSGLNEGDEVVVSDQDTFRPGQRVRPVTVNSAKMPARP